MTSAPAPAESAATLPAPPTIAIGFRAESSSINWAVVTRPDNQLLLVADGAFDHPKTFDEAGSLAWFRNRLHQLIDQYRPTIGGVRYPETSARKPKHPVGAQARLRVEGVILESLASRAIRVVTGGLTTISSEMGSSSAKSYLQRSNVRGLDWTGKPTERREAIIVAIAALENAEKQIGAHGHQQ